MSHYQMPVRNRGSFMLAGQTCIMQAMSFNIGMKRIFSYLESDFILVYNFSVLPSNNSINYARKIICRRQEGIR